MSRQTDLLFAGAMDSKASHSALRQYYVAVGEEGAKLVSAKPVPGAPRPRPP